MAPPKQPKTFSSALLTMGFMRRAAAAQAPSAPSTPEGPPSKRQRLSAPGTPTSANGSPATPRTDQELVTAALAAEEAKRQVALDRQAAEAGETKWVLSFQHPEKVQVQQNGLRVVTAGYAAIDAGDGDSDGDEREVARPVVGRMKYGQNPKEEKKDSSSDGSSSESDEEEDEDEDPTEAMIRRQRTEVLRKERKANKKKKLADMSAKLADRRKKAVNLNNLTTISGGGNAGLQVTCHKCGESGHMMKDCLNFKKSHAKKPYTKRLSCHRCGQAGHVQQDCPQSRKRDRGLDY